RGGEIDDAGKIFTLDQQIDRAREIVFVNPRYKLGAGALWAAQTVANQTQEHIERASLIRTESNGAAHRDLARTRRTRGEKAFFPSFRDVDRKIPGIGSPGL